MDANRKSWTIGLAGLCLLSSCSGNSNKIFDKPEERTSQVLTVENFPSQLENLYKEVLASPNVKIVDGSTDETYVVGKDALASHDFMDFTAVALFGVKEGRPILGVTRTGFLLIPNIYDQDGEDLSYINEAIGKMDVPQETVRAFVVGGDRRYVNQVIPYLGKMGVKVEGIYVDDVPGDVKYKNRMLASKSVVLTNSGLEGLVLVRKGSEIVATHRFIKEEK